MQDDHVFHESTVSYCAYTRAENNDAGPQRCRTDSDTSIMQSFTVQPVLVDPFLQRDLLDFGNAVSQHPAHGDTKVSISCAVGYSKCQVTLRCSMLMSFRCR